VIVYTKISKSIKEDIRRENIKESAERTSDYVKGACDKVKENLNKK
jgi:hypothetical protein